MTESISLKNTESKQLYSLRGLGVMMLLALLLLIRVCWLYFSDSARFPINKVQVAASYQHISHADLESVVSPHLQKSYFSLSLKSLQADISGLAWVDQVELDKIWPDKLKIKVVEKQPVARFNRQLITENGQVFKGKTNGDADSLPMIIAPGEQKLIVLQAYSKFSKILSDANLKIARLRVGKNQSWQLTLANGIELYLGKEDVEKRLKRFSRAYPQLLAKNSGQPVRVDLRYSHAMAVQWT